VPLQFTGNRKWKISPQLAAVIISRPNILSKAVEGNLTKHTKLYSYYVLAVFKSYLCWKPLCQKVIVIFSATQLQRKTVPHKAQDTFFSGQSLYYKVA
jgi:hypothetical protein